MSRYIDADKLIQDLNEYYAKGIDRSWQRGRDAGIGINIAKQIIDNQPTADVQEVKHGEWIKHREHIILASGDIKQWTSYCCSECETPQSQPSKYCPECGAKMDKGEQE